MLFEPILEGEAPILKCSFWVDQREQDPDVVTAAVAEQLWRVVGLKPKRAKPASEPAS
jgi:hypothetical protein